MGQGLSRSSSSLPLQLINHTPECTAFNERHTLVTLESVMAYDDDLPLFSITFISESRILPNVFPTYDHEEALYWVRDMIAVGPRANRPGGAERLRIKLRVRAKAGCKWCATTIVEGTDPEGYRQITEQAYQRDPNIHKLVGVTLVGDLPVVAGGRSTSVQSSLMSRSMADDYFMEPIEFTWRASSSYAEGPRYLTVLEYRPDSDAFRVLLTLQFWLVADWSAFLSEHRLDVNFGHKEILSNLAGHTCGEPGGRTEEGPNSCLPFANPGSIRRTMTTRLKPIPTATIDLGSDGEECGGERLPELLTLEDGPAFRTLIKDLEGQTHGLKRSFKSVIKAVEDLLDPKSFYAELSRACDEALVESPADALASVTSHLKRVLAEQDANEQDFRRRLVGLVLEPLRAHYHDDIKPAEARKRDWEQRSTAYYATVQRYLVKGKHTRKKTASNTEDDDTGSANEHTLLVDAKFAARKAAYEADRVEYACHLWELHDALPKKLALYLKIFAELFYAKSAVAKDQHWEELSAGVEALARQLEAAKSLCDEHLARLQSRRDECLRKWHLQVIGQQPQDESASTQEEQPAKRDTTDSGGYKEGFLYCAAKTTLNKSWNRYWCVLTDGSMAEHHFDEQTHRSDGSDSRTALRLHHSYSLALCTVKASGQGAGNSAHISYQGRRRFCLEVVSAQGWLRVYQAVSEEERAAWIAAIQAQITEWLEGKHGQVRAGQHEPEPMPSLAEEVGPSFYRTADELLDALWTADPDNAVCADCGSPKPDWCSINLGALLCIECAAVHRSLGTHISKIRSIRLDTPTFAPELVDLLMSTGNRVAKAIWEARTPPARITAETGREERERFIRDKYEARAFCIPHHRRSLPSLALDDAAGLQSTGSSRRASIRQ